MKINENLWIEEILILFLLILIFNNHFDCINIKIKNNKIYIIYRNLEKWRLMSEYINASYIHAS